VRSASSASSPRAAVLHLVQGSRRAASGAVVSDRTHMNRTARSSVGLQPPVPRQRGRGRSAPRRIPRCGRSANDPAMHLNPTAAMPCRGLKSQQSGSVSGRRPARSGVSMTRPCCRRIGAAAWAGGGRPSRSRPYAGRGPQEACGRPKSPADSWPCPKQELFQPNGSRASSKTRGRRQRLTGPTTVAGFYGGRPR
jgi:hypothetical protein